MKQNIKYAFCIGARMALATLPVLLPFPIMAQQTNLVMSDAHGAFDPQTSAQYYARQYFVSGMMRVLNGEDGRIDLREAENNIAIGGGWRSEEIASLQKLIRQSAINVARENYLAARNYKAMGVNYQPELNALLKAIADAGGLEEINKADFYPKNADEPQKVIITYEGLRDLDPLILLRPDGVSVRISAGNAHSL